jgi:lysophospholipase L1-like esterase
MKKFLFQGDSITDADRRRDNDRNYGYGYPNLFAAEVLKNRPYEFEFINCGISGDRIVDVYARIKMDIINLKPDYMSLLIGVNDVWHELNEENGVAAPKFEKIYDMLISEILEALPDIKIMLLEPFVLKGFGTERYYDVFREEVKKRSDAVKRIAEKYNLNFVPLQAKFDEAAKGGNDAYWLVDGVHPSAMGHQFIKQQWLNAFKTL